METCVASRIITQLEGVLLAVAIAAAMGVRVVHLSGPLDEPSWRQADTAYMALRMGRETPPDLLRPKAPYRGAVDVKAAEFPIYPFVVALGYKAVGGEHLLVARLITLTFFLGSVFYLFRCVDLFFDRRVAWYTVAVYLMLPLGVFYSRAVHPDFCIIFFCHAFLYHALRFYDTQRWVHYAVAVAAASSAFIMKAPYCFYFGLPLAAYVLTRWDGWKWKNFVTMGAVFAVPLVLAWWFNEHRMALEAPYEESLVYPMKWTREFTNRWFFGSLAMRLNPELWAAVARRTVFQVFTPVGSYVAVMAVAVAYRRGQWRGWLCLLALGAGVVLFGLTVFRHFSSTHDYYSLPLLAPAAIVVALFLAAVAQWGTDPAVSGRGLVGVALTLIFLGAGSAYGLQRGHYFHHDWQRIRAGEAIADMTAPDDLVVSATKGRSTGGPDPRILYLADRLGWTINLDAMDEAALALYREHGADFVALLMTPSYPPEPEHFGVLDGYPFESRELRDDCEEPIGHLVLFNLRASAGDPS